MGPTHQMVQADVGLEQLSQQLFSCAASTISMKSTMKQN